MAFSAEKILENQLMEAGKKLLKPPSSVEELLPLLDQLEIHLSKVEQSPSVSMHNVLSPSMKALVANALLRHSDMDVKVAVASCLSEITRITAPEAPYDDALMKEIFQLIVVAFEKLYDTSSPSYSKRVSILETVAKVRSCVVMLDLECDTLILEMFQHFLKAIRDNHPDNVFSSMETIMVLVLEESEEVSSELLCPLLISVKKENQDVLPIAKRLAEKVLENCAAKLKPYLMQAVQFLGTSVQDYSKVVAAICHETCDNVKHDDGSASEEPMADQEKIQGTVGSDRVTQVAEEQKPEVASPGAVDSIVEKPEKPVLSNGIAQTGKSDSLISSDFLEKKAVSDFTVSLTEDEPNINSSKTADSETNPDTIVKKMEDQKLNSSIHSAEASEISRAVSDKEAGRHVDEEQSCREEANSSPPNDCSIDEAVVPLENEKKTPSLLGSPNITHKETVNVALPSPSKSVLEETNPKRESQRPKKRNSNQDSELDLYSVRKGASSDDQNEGEASPSADVILKKDNKGKDLETKQHADSEDEAPPSADVISKLEREVKKDLEAKQTVHSRKKAKANEGKTSRTVDDILTKESGPASDSEAKSVRRSSKKVDERTFKEDELSLDKKKDRSKKGREKSNSTKEVTGEPSNKVDERTSKEEKLPLDKQEIKTKKGRGEVNSKKELAGEPSNKEKVSSPTSRKSSNEHQGHLEETPNTKPKRKRTPGKEEASETPNSVRTGKDLIGKKIKVWWPLDKKFYEGTVDSFDSVKMRHKVVYVDGEIENLNLERQKWEIVVEDAVPEREEATEPSSPDSSEMIQKKKAKIEADSSASQAKTNSSGKRRERSSTKRSKGVVAKFDGDKLKDSTSKPADKSKDESSSKSKEGPPKSSSKLKKEEPQNPGSKSRDKSSSKPKEEKDGKFKDETPKTISKQKEPSQKRDAKIKVMVKDDSATPQKSGSKAKGEAGTTSNSKSSANGTSAKKGKSGSSSKVQESSSKGKEVKAEESETKSGKKNKAQESETKSGRKRPRRVK